MKCQEFELAVVDLVHAPVADPVALEHAAECERCGARLATERTLSAELRAVAADDSRLAPPPRLEADLRAAFRRIAEPEPEPVVRRGVAAWAAAAAIAALVGGGLVYRAVVRPVEPDSPVAATTVNPAPLPTSAPDARVVPPRSVDHGTSVGRQVVDRPGIRRRLPSAEPAERRPDGPIEIATEYFPLVGADTIAPVDGGQVVRVELPRSALASLGLEMNMARSDEPITADVLLGHDGVARAIRFVQSSSIPAERRIR